ncbi:MAG TPA: hypothetical protein VK540_19125 [Polyangiaceae bacterium]|nr:hypothetical protein [Polyangiaceae bacterium]
MKSGWVLRPGAAEFPHENALLDRGAMWIGAALCGAEEDETTVTAAEPRGLRTEPRPSPDAPASSDASGETEDGPQRAHDERVESYDERVENFVRAISEVARAHGAAETAAHVESLFKFGTPAALELSPSARAALLDGNILEASEGGIQATAWFARTSSAWQSMLRGEAGNLAVCGESTLDGWTADLIACLVAKPSMASAIRRDLRRRGIAAFGMLDS